MVSVQIHLVLSIDAWHGNNSVGESRKFAAELRHLQHQAAPLLSSLLQAGMQLFKETATNDIAKQCKLELKLCALQSHHCK